MTSLTTGGIYQNIHNPYAKNKESDINDWFLYLGFSWRYEFNENLSIYNKEVSHNYVYFSFICSK